MYIDLPDKMEYKDMPTANVRRIMKEVLPKHIRLSKESVETIKECVTEFILFITSECVDICKRKSSKKICGEDILFAMKNLGFDNYLTILKSLFEKIDGMKHKIQENKQILFFLK